MFDWCDANVGPQEDEQKSYDMILMVSRYSLISRSGSARILSGSDAVHADNSM